MIRRILFGGLVFAFAFFSIFLTGCGKEAEKKPPQNTQKEESQKPKEPKEIKDITKEIENILKESEKKLEKQEKPSQSQEQSKQGQESSQSQSGQGGEQGSQKSEIEDWAGEEKAVQSINEKWNSLETATVKAGAQDALIKETETNLDSLTNQVMGKSIMGTQKAANELYGSIVKIADLFQTDNPPPADMMKYFTQKTLLAIEEDNWQDAASNVKDLKNQWEKVKTMLDKNGAELSTKMDYAISDFEQSIDKKNKDVAKIKGEIVLSSIEKIIEKMKESKEQ